VGVGRVLILKIERGKKKEEDYCLRGGGNRSFYSGGKGKGEQSAQYGRIEHKRNSALPYQQMRGREGEGESRSRGTYGYGYGWLEKTECIVPLGLHIYLNPNYKPSQSDYERRRDMSYTCTHYLPYTVSER